MGDSSQNEKPQVVREDPTPPGSLDPQIDSQTGVIASESGESLPEHASTHLSSRIPAPSPRLIRDSGLWVWLWVIGAVVLVAFIIVLMMALPSKKSVGPIQHSVAAPMLPLVV